MSVCVFVSVCVCVCFCECVACFCIPERVGQDCCCHFSLYGRLLVEGGMEKEEKEEHEREMRKRRNRKCEEEVAWMEGGTGGRRRGTVVRKERMRERMGSKEEEWEGRESGKRRGGMERERKSGREG